MLRDCAFWNDLEHLEMIHRPLNKAKRKSESNGEYIGFVILR